MSARRIIPVLALVVVGAALLVARQGLGGGASGLLSLDGSSRSQSQGAATRDQSAGREGGAEQATATPDSISVDSLDEESIRKDAFILLNPASATAGSNVAVNGSGFDPASVIDFYLTSDPRNDPKPQNLGFAQADSGGSFGGFGFSLPPNYRASTFTVIARQRDSDKEAQATGRLETMRPSVKLGTGVGVVGDQVQVSAQGFLPGEEVKVYFNSLGGDPFQTFNASDGGTIEKQSIRIPYGPVGNNSLIFVGDQSMAPVTVQFLMLSLYPDVALSSYATKADTAVSFSGKGFGPDEEVAVHLNNPQAPPILKVRTADDGSFDNAGAFVIPFQLTGKNTLIFVGEKSQATATAGFDVLPYTPNVQPSTYGGRPGTTITFYGEGFARDEVVRFYVERTQDSPGKEVACAKADDVGQIGAGGSYTIPPTAEAGQLEFQAVGSRSKAVANTTVEVMDAGVPLQAAAQPEPEFRCPYDDQESSPDESTARPAPPAPTPSGNRTSLQGTPQPRPTPRVTPTPQSTPAAARQGGRSGEVAGGAGEVGLLSDPANSNSVKIRLEPGTTVEITGDSRTVGNQQWLRVKGNGQEGWVPAESILVAPGSGQQSGR
ncbi:MAG: SH3 domain-containing protein [Sphingomonadaceae bacterium]